MKSPARLLVVSTFCSILAMPLSANAGQSAKCDRSAQISDLKLQIREIDSELQKQKKEYGDDMEAELREEELNITGDERRIATLDRDIMNVERENRSDDPRQGMVPAWQSERDQVQGELDELQSERDDLVKQIRWRASLKKQRKADEVVIVGAEKACTRAGKQPDDLDLFVAGLQDGLNAGNKPGSKSHPNDPRIASRKAKQLDEAAQSAYDRGYKKGLEESSAK